MATVVKTVPQPVVPRMAPREDLNPFRIAQIQFDMAAEYLKLDPGLRQILRTDLENGHGEPALWRRQGRCRVRSQAHVKRRTRAHDSPLRR